MFCIVFVFILLSVSLYAEDHDIGDMILDDYQFYQFTSKRSQSDSVGFLSSGRSGEQYRWPHGELPYETYQLNQQQKRVLEDVIAHFNSKFHGCIKIRPRTHRDADYVQIVRESFGGSCGRSRVGRIQQDKHGLSLQKQYMFINCFNQRTILHEFMHAFGFTHEQNRPDRNKYVKIHRENIKDYYKSENVQANFATDEEYSETYGLPYDGKSLLHYNSMQFSNGNGEPTITSKIPGISTEELGSSNDLTPIDILKLKNMYKCTSPDPSPSPSPAPLPYPSPEEPRGNVCDRQCKSDNECSGSDTCNRCCWWFGYGSVCSAPVLGVGCIQTN
jgi:hypothetical protein